MIFRAEAQLRTRALQSQAKAEAEAKIAIDSKNELTQKIYNLEKDKAKAKQLSMKAIAARSEIKKYLDNEKAKNEELQD